MVVPLGMISNDGCLIITIIDNTIYKYFIFKLVFLLDSPSLFYYFSDFALQLPSKILYLSSPQPSALLHFNVHINTQINIHIKLNINNHYYFSIDTCIYNDIHTKYIVHIIVEIIIMYLLLNIVTKIMKSQSPFQSVEM